MYTEVRHDHLGSQNTNAVLTRNKLYAKLKYQSYVFDVHLYIRSHNALSCIIL